VGDKYDELYAAVPATLSSPWDPNGNYEPDYECLQALVEVTVRNGKAFKPQTGALAAATNVWVATELRRAGVDPDRVWPRSTSPRVMPWDATAAAASLKRHTKPHALRKKWGVSNQLTGADLEIVQRKTIEALLAEIGKGPGVPPDPATRRLKNPANILGAHFPKEIDVSMARYDRGLELGVSTKTMIREPTKNIPNRREEASGDLLNIRRRFPLSVFGYFFLLEAGIAETAAHFEKVVDMCRKVTLSTPGDEANAYDASCLMVVELQQSPPRVEVEVAASPGDLRASRFFDKMLDALMTRSQADDHHAARELWKAAKRTA
jgi:hypothetical protein